MSPGATGRKVRPRRRALPWRQLLRSESRVVRFQTGALRDSADPRCNSCRGPRPGGCLFTDARWRCEWWP